MPAAFDQLSSGSLRVDPGGEQKSCKRMTEAGVGYEDFAAGEEDLNAVAASIVDRSGKLVAILGVQGPAVRFSPRAMRAAVEQLTDKAAFISSAL